MSGHGETPSDVLVWAQNSADAVYASEHIWMNVIEKVEFAVANMCAKFKIV